MLIKKELCGPCTELPCFTRQMIMYHTSLIALSFLIALLLSCNGPSTKGRTASLPTLNKVRVHAKPGSSFKDSLLISKDCVVFYAPDSLQLEQIRRITTDQVFRGSMHEFIYQTRNAHIYLKKYWPHLDIIDAKNVRYLVFDSQAGKVTIDLDTADDPYGMYIYSTQTAPRQLDMMNVETQVPEYFRDHTLPLHPHTGKS